MKPDQAPPIPKHSSSVASWKYKPIWETGDKSAPTVCFENLWDDIHVRDNDR